MGGFCLLLDAPHIVYTTRNEVDHKLQGVFMRGMCNYNVVELAGGESVINWGTLSSFEA